MILVDASGVSVSRPDRPLFTDLSITVESGDRFGVVGLNGSGKTTLLRVINGDATAESGVVRRGRGVRIAMLDQEPKLTPGTVRGNVVEAVAEGAEWEAEAVLDHLGMGGLLDADVSTLSGGQAKRVALARVLVSDADLLILDEPTNHLDLDAIAWLEERLARSRAGLLMVTHDRHVLDRVCTKVLEIDRGEGYVHAGGYQAYLEGRDAREERAAASEATRRNLAKRELAWLRRGAPARSRKPKAHIDSAVALIEGGPKAAARPMSLELDAAVGRSGDGQGRSAGSMQGSYRNAVDERLAPRLGNKVIELHGVGHRFGAERWLFEGLEWLLDPGERYGIVGANGSGKSTLLEIISGRLAPAAGSVDVGPTVRVGYYDQLGRSFDLTQRVREAVAGNVRPVGTPEDKKLMEQFWFDDDLQWAPIRTLSGGERRRLQLLMVLAERPNVLLLDEPTNDLDLDTLRVMEEFLEDWPGTLVVVSHDRTFMDRVVSEVFALEGARAALVNGGYAGWRASRDASTSTSLNAGVPVLAGVGAERPPVIVPARMPTDVAPLKRSSSTLRFLMKEIERDMSKATKRRDAAQGSLDAAVAVSGHSAMAAAGVAMAAAQADVELAEERWLEIAAEAER